MNRMPSSPAAPKLKKSLEIRSRVLEATHAFGRAVSRELKIDPLCDLVVYHLTNIFDSETTALLFLDEARGELYVKRIKGAAEDESWTTARVKKGQGVAGGALARQELVCVREGDPQLEDPSTVEAFGHAHTMAAVPLKDEDATPLSPPSTPSTAAAPLMAERKVKGVVALTWAPKSGRPTDDDLAMLDILSAQVANAIDNAWLYEELTRFSESLEQKVAERTAELRESNTQLEQALEELKQTQAQLVQNEKMASLGQLTAGVAHEINNPLAYSISNIALARERLANLGLRHELITTALAMEEAQSASEKRQAGMSLVESLKQKIRYREDVLGFSSEVSTLPDDDAVTLITEFLSYVNARENKDAARHEVVHSVDRLLERSYQGLERVKDIVLDLRSFSRLDEATFQTVDIDEGIAGTLSIVGHLAKERGVAIKHLPALEAPYTCFSAKLNQVVLNLLTNALQATFEGGTVTVRTQESPKGPRIDVTDTGSGIPKEDLNKIFDPFFTTKPVGYGTGLGLSISYRIIEEHGGSITVESAPGEGSRFSIQLPPRPK